MSIKDEVNRSLDTLGEAELRQVADYVAFLKFRTRLRAPLGDPAQWAALYAESAEEDRALAEEGIAEYQRGLLAEDAP